MLQVLSFVAFMCSISIFFCQCTSLFCSVVVVVLTYSECMDKHPKKIVETRSQTAGIEAMFANFTEVLKQQQQLFREERQEQERIRREE